MTRSLRLGLVLLGLTGALCADQTLHFDAVSGTYGGHAYNAEFYYGPYYVSPYFGSIGNNTAGSTVLFCLDFDHYINVPDQTTAVFRTLPTDPITGPAAIAPADQHYQFGAVTAGVGSTNFISGALPTTFSGGGANTGATISGLTAYQRYEAAIYLLYNNLTLPGPPVFTARSRALYQYAMWAMFLQNGPPDGNGVYKSAIQTINSHDGSFGADVNTLIIGAYNEVTNAANQSFLTSLLPYFTVIDAIGNPTDPGNKYQEFLSPSVIPPDLPGVPEPSSFLLFGTTVSVIGLVWRRRRTA